MYDNVRLIYSLFLFSTIAVLFITGKEISKTKGKKNYWKYSIPIILMYSAFYGLRFGRQIDWNVYYHNYYGIGYGVGGYKYEFLFTQICKLFVYLDIPYFVFISFCAALYIIALLRLFKPYSSYLHWILLFLFIYDGGIELLVRWCLAVPFVLYGYCHLRESVKSNALIPFDKREIIIYLVSCTIGVLIHEGVILLIPFFLIMLFINKRIPSFVIFVGILFTSFFASTDIFSVFTDYLNIFTISEKTTNYIDKFDQILTVGLKGDGLRERTIWNTLKNIFMFTYPLFCVGKFIKSYKIATSDFNIWAIGIIFMPLLTKAEILDRYYYTMSLFMGVIEGGAIAYSYKNWRSQHLWYKVYTHIMVLLVIYVITRGIILREGYELLFIWDAGQRETLPLQLFRK